MSENQINDSANNQPAQPVQPANYLDERENWRAQRRAWRDERRAARHSGTGAWIGGAVLIMLGLIFLAQNTGIFILHNWWALFILIPAFGAYSAAYGMYRANGGHLNYAVRSSLIGGVFFTLLTGAFLFDVAAGFFWPLILILAGVALLANFAFPQSQ